MTLRRKSRPCAWLVGILLASVSTVPSYAVENVRREVHHFFECLDMMLSSPADHKANCQPNRVPGPFGSIQSTGGSDTQPVAPPAPPAPPMPPVVVAEPPPPPVVEPPPPPPPAPDPCACGSCYAT